MFLKEQLERFDYKFRYKNKKQKLQDLSRLLNNGNPTSLWIDKKVKS